MIATSSSPTGQFTASTTSYNTPPGYGNTDVNLFQESDGTAYVVFTSQDSTKIIIYRLASDYMSVTGTASIFPATPASRDAPVIFKRGSVYFLVSSGQNSWTATNIKYSTTTTPLGTWSALVNPFQVATEDYTTGYNTIISDVISVVGRTDGYIYVGERYDTSAVTTGSLYNSRFVWLPIVFPTTGTMSISWHDTWDLDSSFSSSVLPSAATGINIVKTSSSQVDITWTNHETTSYELYLDRASDTNFTQNVTSKVLVSSSVSYSDTSVSGGNVYYYRLRTVNAAGSANSSTGIANYSAASDVTPPTIGLLAPTSNAVIIGSSVLLSATSTDDIGITEVRFYVSGILVGTSTSTTSPNNFYWNSKSVSDGTRPLIAVAVDGGGNTATTSSINIIVSNNVPILFTSTSTVLQNSTTTLTIIGNATTWTPGTPGTPTFTLSGGSGSSIVSQVISSATTSSIVIGAGRSVGTLILTDPLCGATTSLTVAADTSVPDISLTTPSGGATLTGTTTLVASATDNVAVASIQFKLDTSTNIGPASSTSPYSYAWSTVGTANGTHTILAVATDYSGNISTSTVATVTVNNLGLSTVTTASPTGTSTFSAIFNGAVTVDGGASTTVRGFNYGLTTSYTATTSETGTFSIGSFSTTTLGLSCATTYHVRAFAINLSGIAYGTDKTVTTLTCPTASASGEIQYSVSPAYQFGLIPSYLNIGHVPAYVFDGDFTTWWDTNAADGAYVGLDLTVAARVTRMRIAPHSGYTVRVYGAILQGSNATSSSVGPWTSIYTIPSFPPYYAQKQLSEISVDTGGATYRYYRLLMANGTNGHLAEFRLIGLPGTTTPYLPVTPVISPNGGQFDLPTKVRISSITTDSTIYYTTDGTAPTFIGGSPQGTTQQYSGPFVVTNTATTTVKAIAVSQGTYVSEISEPAQFYISTDNKPGGDWLDTDGHLIESHDGGFGYFNGKYYWYGQIFNANDPENESVGISAYSSPDLINWKNEGPIIYLGRTDKLERPHVIYNDTTHKYVMWAHNIISYPNSRAYIAYSDNPTGPFTLSSSTYNPDGMGLNDMNLFKDTDGKAYVVYSNGNNTKLVISQLTTDYLGTLQTVGASTSPANLVNREAPAIFKRNGVYYMMTSGVTGWPPNLNKFSTSTSVLGSWSLPVSPFQVDAVEDVTTSYRSQTTDVLTIAGRSDAYVYIGDRNDSSNYNGGSLYNSRHVWLPMTFDTSGMMSISWRNNWNLNTIFPTSTLPLPASGFSVSKTNSEVDLSWVNNATTSYSLFVDRATDSAFTQNVVSDVVASTTTSYIDTYSYNPAVTYYYKVRTLTGSGTANSAIMSTQILTPATPPAPVLDVSSDSGVSSSDNITSITTPTLQGTASSSVVVNIIKNGTIVVGSTTSDGVGNWTYTLSTPLNVDGTYTFAVTQSIYGGVSATSSALTVIIDTAAPVISITTPANNLSLANWATLVSWDGSSACYRSMDGGSFTLTNCAITDLSLSAPSIASHTLVIKGTDIAGNIGYATSTFTYAPDLSIPSISSVNITPSNNLFAVSWTTSKNASTLVNYGLTSDYDLSTAETDTSPRLTSHNVTVGSLLPCTLYHYELMSVDAFAIVGTSTDSTFITTGCTGSGTSGSSVFSSSNQSIGSATGGHVSNSNLTLNISAGFSSTPSLIFQAKKLDTSTFFAVAGTPSDKSVVGSDVIDLKAYLDASTTVASFLNDIQIVMSYSLSEVSNIDEDSLLIYRYDGSAWHALTGCQIDKVQHTVSCYTSLFSDFALFGTSIISPTPTPVVVAPINSYSSHSGGFVSLDVLRKLFSPSTSTTAYLDSISSLRNYVKENTVASYNQSSSTVAYRFKRVISIYSVDEDVRQLQKYLNNHGFVIAVVGDGSPGRETAKFGAKTKAALTAFQKKHGIKPANGTLGPVTSNYIMSHN